MAVLRRALTGRYGIAENYEAFIRAWDLVDARADFRMHQLPNFVSLLHYRSFGYFLTAFNHHQCKDDHDRVYAFLGFLDTSSPIKIIPDYAKPIAQVYMDINIQLLAARELEVLYAAGLCHLKEEMRDPNPDFLPSWAVEYRPSHRVDFNPPISRNFFSAAINRHPTLAILPQRSFTTLAVQGIRVCVLSHQHVDKPPNTPYRFLSTMKNLLFLCRDIYAHFGLTLYNYGDNEDVAVAAFRTLLSDGSDTEVDVFLQTSVRRNMTQLWNTYSAVCIEPEGEIAKLAVQALQSVDQLEPAWYDEDFYSSLSPEAKQAWQCHKMLYLALSDKAFVITEAGMFGLVPNCQMAGDTVALFDGMEVPVLLRTLVELDGDFSVYQLVGVCYIHGIMYGETCVAALEDQRRSFNII